MQSYKDQQPEAFIGQLKSDVELITDSKPIMGIPHDNGVLQRVAFLAKLYPKKGEEIPYIGRVPVTELIRTVWEVEFNNFDNVTKDNFLEIGLDESYPKQLLYYFKERAGLPVGDSELTEEIYYHLKTMALQAEIKSESTFSAKNVSQDKDRTTLRLVLLCKYLFSKVEGSNEVNILRTAKLINILTGKDLTNIRKLCKEPFNKEKPENEEADYQYVRDALSLIGLSMSEAELKNLLKTK